MIVSVAFTTNFIPITLVDSIDILGKHISIVDRVSTEDKTASKEDYIGSY